VNTVFHSKDEIERAASRLPCVPTDNLDALIALGFERMYPQISSGYDSRLWVRAVESDSCADSSRGRRRIVQRAFLELSG